MEHRLNDKIGIKICVVRPTYKEQLGKIKFRKKPCCIACVIIFVLYCCVTLGLETVNRCITFDYFTTGHLFMIFKIKIKSLIDDRII